MDKCKSLFPLLTTLKNFRQRRTRFYLLLLARRRARRRLSYLIHAFQAVGSAFLKPVRTFVRRTEVLIVFRFAANRKTGPATLETTLFMRARGTRAS